MEEEFSVQMANEVQNIDYRKSIQDTIQEQQNSQNTMMNVISNKIDNIADSITPEVDLTEVTDMINELDTNTITAQNEDIMMIVQEQQDKISIIEEKVENIARKQENTSESIQLKLDAILEKLE